MFLIETWINRSRPQECAFVVSVVLHTGCIEERGGRRWLLDGGGEESDDASARIELALAC